MELLIDKVISGDTYQAHLVESVIRQWINQGRKVKVKIELLGEEDDSNNVPLSSLSSATKCLFTSSGRQGELSDLRQ